MSRPTRLTTGGVAATIGDNPQYGASINYYCEHHREEVNATPPPS